MLVKRINHSGYTTIEIITVVAILSIMTSLILPNYKFTLDKYKIEIAARKLAKDILYAQQRSICKKVKYHIIFDRITKDNYTIASGFNSRTVNLPPGIYIDWVNFAKYELSFNPVGVPKQGGTIALKSDSKNLYIIVSVATGRVRISNTPPSMEEK